MSELDWLDGLVAGDKKIIETIYANHMDTVKKWIVNNGGGHHDAVDVFQDSLMQIIIAHKKRGIGIRTSFSSYLITTCKYQWIKKKKQDKRLKEVIKESERTLDYNNAHADVIMYKILDRTILLLSEKCQKLLRLVGQGVPTPEIAIAMNMTNENTVYRRKFACLKRWQEIVNQDKEYPQWKLEQYG